MPPTLKDGVLVVSADAFDSRFLPAIRHLLGDTGLARQTGLPEDLTRAMAQPGKRPVMVLLHDPVVSLAHRLADGAAPQTGLHHWMTWAESLLKAQRKDRRRITLVDARLFAVGTTDDHARLAQRLGVPVPDPGTALNPGAPPAALRLLAALALLAVTPRANDLAQELRALMLQPETGPVSAETVQAALTRTDAIASEETRLLREGMRLQNEIVDQLAAAKTRNSELVARLADHELLAAEVDALSRQLAEAEAARKRHTALLGAQLLDDGERLAVSERKAAELGRVYASRSWRITRPLRSLRRPSNPR